MMKVRIVGLAGSFRARKGPPSVRWPRMPEPYSPDWAAKGAAVRPQTEVDACANHCRYNETGGSTPLRPLLSARKPEL